MDYGYENFSYNEGGFNADDNFQNEGNSQKPQMRQRITPVTIKQINEAVQLVPDGDWTIHNIELNMVSFVGVIRSITNNTLSITISLEDGTGGIEIRRWINSEDNSSDAEFEKFAPYEKKYVHVSGVLRSQGDKKTVQHSVIRPIEDHNEILYHHLSAIQAHVKAQGVKEGDSAKKEDSLFVADDTNASLHDRVVAVIKENSEAMAEGVHVALVAQKLGITVDTAMNLCNELSESGRVYAGYDEQAFLCL